MIELTGFPYYQPPTYNGWANRETWNVTLWVFNDEGLYNTWKGYYGCRRWTVEGVKTFLKHIWPDGATPDGDRWEKANLEEIADAWNEEVEDDWSD